MEVLLQVNRGEALLAIRVGGASFQR